MRGNVAVLTLMACLMRCCVSQSASPDDDKVRIASLEKEVVDLKNFIELVLQQLVLNENRITAFNDRLNVLETTKSPDVKSFETRLSNVEDAMRNQNTAMKNLSDTTDKAIISQQVVETLIDNHTDAINHNVQSIKNLKDKDLDLESKLDAVRASLKNASDLVGDEITKLTKKQFNAANRMTREIHAMNRMITLVGDKSQVLHDDVLGLKQGIGSVQKQITDYQSRTNEKPNIQDYVWRGDTEKDNGRIKSVTFKKFNKDSSLRVTYHGNIRQGYGGHCSRWYFMFNGVECSIPEKVEAVLYTDYDNDWAMPSVVSGVCQNIPNGDVKIDFLVGLCGSGDYIGNALTGWSSTSRITVEEF